MYVHNTFCILYSFETGFSNCFKSLVQYFFVIIFMKFFFVHRMERKGYFLHNRVCYLEYIVRIKFSVRM